jgi:hypothetical protein
LRKQEAPGYGPEGNTGNIQNKMNHRCAAMVPDAGPRASALARGSDRIGEVAM